MANHAYHTRICMQENLQAEEELDLENAKLSTDVCIIST